MVGGSVRADRRGTGNVLHGGLIPAQLSGQYAQKVQRVGMLRLDFQNPPVDLRGGLQTARLVVLESNRQCFGNRCQVQVQYGTFPTREG